MVQTASKRGIEKVRSTALRERSPGDAKRNAGLMPAPRTSTEAKALDWRDDRHAVHSFRRMAYCIVFSNFGAPSSSVVKETNSLNSPSFLMPNRSHRRREGMLSSST